MKVNVLGADWQIIRKWVGVELAAARSRLEGPLPIDDTMFERGKIASLKSLLDLVEPTPAADYVEDVNYG